MICGTAAMLRRASSPSPGESIKNREGDRGPGDGEQTKTWRSHLTLVDLLPVGMLSSVSLAVYHMPVAQGSD